MLVLAKGKIKSFLKITAFINLKTLIFYYNEYDSEGIDPTLRLNKLIEGHRIKNLLKISLVMTRYRHTLFHKKKNIRNNSTNV